MVHYLLHNNLLISFCIITSMIGNFKDLIFNYKLKKFVVKQNIKNTFLIATIIFDVLRNYILIGFVTLLLLDLIKL